MADHHHGDHSHPSGARGSATAVLEVAGMLRGSQGATVEAVVRHRPGPAVDALHELGVEVVMLTGDNEATALRIAGQFGIDTVIAEVLPCDKAAKIAELQRGGRGTLRKLRQNFGWAIGYNAIALPIAAGVFQPSLGLVLRPEIAALTMSGPSLIVAVSALMLKRLRLPEAVFGHTAPQGGFTAPPLSGTPTGRRTTEQV